jgi:uncharacterized RDD family membrane protein YckC
LASRLARLGARLIDSALVFGAAVGGLVVANLVSPTEDEVDLAGVALQDARTAIASTAVLGGLLIFLLNVILLSVRGQSVGKWLLRIRIVRDPDNERVGFLRGFLLRDGVTLLIKLVPFVGTIYVWINGLFIFNAERRCLHDFIAGTRVVQVQPEGHADYPAE